jgi:hypothetical protein
MSVHSWSRPDLIRERHLDLRRLDFNGAVLDSRAGFAGRAGPPKRPNPIPKHWPAWGLAGHRIPACGAPNGERRSGLHFLRQQNPPDMPRLDREFRPTQIGKRRDSAPVAADGRANRYQPAYSRLEEFPCSAGRRKFLKPLCPGRGLDIARSRRRPSDGLLT